MRLICAGLVLAGCYQPTDTGDGPGITAPSDLFPPDAPVDAGPPPLCGGADPSPLSRLAVTVRTTPVGGTFAPRNVGAIWIERADGSFVRTLERWARVRGRWLLRFNASSQGNIVDAITSATLTSHKTHEVSWDLRDAEGCEIEAGDYQVVFELTDRNAAGESLAIPFTKDTAPVSLAPAETRTFHDLSIELN